MKKIINEFELVPDWYGIAYLDFSRLQAICYPVPLNVVVRWIRRLYLFLAFSGYERSDFAMRFGGLLSGTAEFSDDTPVRIEVQTPNGYAVTVALGDIRKILDRL